MAISLEELKEKKRKKELQRLGMTDEDLQNSYFTKGTLDDGYQFGDVLKGVRASMADAQHNVREGIIGMGEQLVDAGASVVGGIGGIFSKDFKERVGDFIEKDLYDEDKVADHWLTRLLMGGAAMPNMGEKTLNRDADSFLGNKTDELVQSGAELGAKALIQYASGGMIPWWAMTGATTMGSSLETNLKEGASFNEAMVVSALQTGLELGTEKLFGASGLGEKGVINTDWFTRNIGNKVLKSLADFGVDMASEGVEELVSEFGSNLATMIYKDESFKDVMLSEEAFEGYVDSFIGGAVLGGVMNTPKVASSVKSKTDYRTGYTQNEQKVVDTLMENMVKEKEKSSGKKLSKKERLEVTHDVNSMLERGEVDLDFIEEVLGGDSYSAYDRIRKEADEFTTLYDTESGKLSRRQQDRLAELVKKNEENSYEKRILEARKQLNDSMAAVTENDGFLQRSYAEKGKRSQAFQADVSQYDEKHQETIQRAIDSGILNDTRKTHEFVDLLAKISADKGISFDFANNEMLKQSGYAIEGKTVNGVKDGNNITININAAKSLNSVVGHEITHVLEGTEHYDALQQAVFEYAKTIGEYDSRLETLTELYKGVKDANVEAELTADLVGDYIFADEEFVRHLSTKNRNIFQKIYDEIKYLCKVVTAGSKEARQLEKAKKTFEKVYKETSKTGTKSTEYSLADIEGMTEKSYNHHGWAKVNDVLSSRELADFQMKVGDKARTGESWYLELGDGRHMFAVGVDGVNSTLIISDGNFQHPSIDKVYHIGLDNETDIEIVRDAIYDGEKNGEWSLSSIAITEIFEDEITGVYSSEDFQSFQTMWEEYRSTGAKGKRSFRSSRTVQNGRRGNSKTGIEYSVSENSEVSSSDGTFFGGENATETRQYSLSDSVYSKLAKDPEKNETKLRRMVERAAVRSGYTERVMHGTEQFGFTKVDVSKSDDGLSFFATSSMDTVESYSGVRGTQQISSEAFNIGNYDLYANTDGFLVLDCKGSYWHDIESELLPRLVDVPQYKPEGIMSYNWDTRAVSRYAKDQGYRGVLFKNIKDDGGRSGGGVFDDADVYNFFYPEEQVKSADLVTYDENGEVIPLSQRFHSENDDLRYSLSESKMPVDELKQKQLDIVLENNPAGNTYSTWIREVGDILTYEEALNSDDYIDYKGEDFDPSYPYSIAEEALKSGKIMVYSSYPIEQGVFVSPSFMEAQMYSGTGQVYSKQVNLTDVAWIDPTQGQYAQVEENKSVNVNGQQYILQDSKTVSYSEISKIGTVKGPVITETYSEENEYDLDERIKAAIDSCEEVSGTHGYVQMKGYPYRIKVTHMGLRHGLIGKKLTGKQRRVKGKAHVRKTMQYCNADICDNYGEIIKNSVVVNELDSRNGGLVLMGYARSMDNDYVIRTIVQKVDGEYIIESWDSTLNLKAVNTKKIETRREINIPTEEELNSISNVSTISIDEFLQIVNDASPEFADTLSDDVLSHFGNRKSEKPSLEVKYSISDNSVESEALDGWNVQGEDIALEGVPIREDVQTGEKGKVAPVQLDDISKKNRSLATVIDEQAPIYTPETTRSTASTDSVSQTEENSTDFFETEESEIQSEESQEEEEEIAYEKKNAEKIRRIRANIEGFEMSKGVVAENYDASIAKKQEEYESLKRKDTKRASHLLEQIETLKARKEEALAELDKRIKGQKKAIENIRNFERVRHRKKKQNTLREWARNLLGDTTHWKDKKLGLYYQTNTLKRNLRDIVRGEDGKRDIARADEIYAALQGMYNHNEAALNREANQIKETFRKMNINAEESTYIQMLGEYKYNPECTITPDVIKEYYEKHKKKIDMAKVDSAIESARKVYDDLYHRLNQVLREHGFKEIGYIEGYFPHFTEEKQGVLGKLFNWKTRDDNIPTDIAGLTEQFNPERSYQSFDKHRTGDGTTYDFLKGMDTYIHGALDWIYHIEDIQKRRAFENEIRYQHSAKGIQEQIEEVLNKPEYDADMVQQKIDEIYANARNPLNNFVTDFRTGTNMLAGKKSSLDREMEYSTNRKIYSVMTNLSSRVSANMVAGSISSALTNFIPITQSWAQVSPIRSLQAMKATIGSYIRDDGTVDKSDFLTNRLRKNENLHKTRWDKAGEVAGWLMESIDDFTSQTVWRSKYLDNLHNGMSEADAIANADQFAESVLAGRSRGNMPTIFESKNPIVKMFTAFQLEVNNQYGYLFKDTPQDVQNKGKLMKGYAAAFLGAYAYNALYSSLVGRDAAFDPIGIMEDLLRDLGLLGDDEEEEPIDIIGGLAENVAEELPFVGGVLGGGRIPINSAIPYEDPVSLLKGTAQDFNKGITEGDWKDLTSEWMKPIFYLMFPMGGGQIKKTIQGLQMYDDDLPIAGSYTNSGKLRFTVDDDVPSKLQAAVFGQYSSENAREYFDRGQTPLSEKKTQELIDLDIPISEYWDIQDALKEKTKLGEKADAISELDLPVEKKNLLINNAADREEPIDMTDYEMFADFEEFDFAQQNPGRYQVAQLVGGYQKYMQYTEELNEIEGDKNRNGETISGSRKIKVMKYLKSLDLSNEERMILFKSQFPGDSHYNNQILRYIQSSGVSGEEKKMLLDELGFIN